MGRTFGQKSLHRPSPGAFVSSAGAGFSTTVALKENHIQLVTDPYGDIAKDGSGHGLYMLDTRYLSQLELSVNGQQPIYLSHSADRNYIATFQFVNHAFTQPDGSRVPRQTISIRRSRFVDAQAMHERIGFYNCNQFPVVVEAVLTFDADFADIFAVRDFASQQQGVRRSVHFGSQRLTFTYQGRDQINRRTVIEYDRESEPKSSNSVLFRLELQPHAPESITLRVAPQAGHARSLPKQIFDGALEQLAHSYEEWHLSSTTFETNNELFDRSLLRQSRLDIRALMEFVRPPGESRDLLVPDAGIPWYAVPFGRDSIITALQALPYNPLLAEGTLRFLAQYQGTKVDPQTEEEPGKILHELRRGELAHLREIPHLPYYGTVDATPLFALLFVETMSWLGHTKRGKSLYVDLLPHALDALEWCDTHGDIDGDGYVEYRPGRSGGVHNQGWKDSFDSLQYQDGSSAKLPAALVEVQAYVYAAKDGLGRLTRERGDTDLSTRLRAEANRLKQTFNRDFWMDEERFLAQALDGDKQQVGSVTSNPGHALWCGIVDAEKGRAVADRLVAPDMFSGWGVRTLSSLSPNYNPMSYHNGSIWPHDNSLIALGLRRYGCDTAAAQVIEAVIGAGLRFPGNRLPELFCGFPRDLKFNSIPVSYMVSCSPQAWAAAAPFLFLQTLLGLKPLAGEALEVNPIRTNLFYRYRVVGMTVGDARASFEVHQTEEGLIRRLGAAVEVTSSTATVA